MAKKTAVRRLSKMLPLSSEIMSHVERDDDQFAGMRDANPRKNPFAALPMTEDAPQADPPAVTAETPADAQDGKESAQ
jgi:recombinational DNA repair protein RecT